MKTLDSVQLVAVRGGGAPIDSFAAAMAISMRGLKFGKSLLIADNPPELSWDGIDYQSISPMDLNGYNDFMLSRLVLFQKLPYVLIVQADGFVVSPGCWDDSFLEYDYIGAPWPAPEGQQCAQGNGGFSLRSKKLNEIARLLHRKWPRRENEDAFICTTHRHEFEEMGCRFAPADVAAKFSVEFTTWHHDGGPTLGFHGYYEGRNGTYFPMLQMEINNKRSNSK